MRMHMDDPVSIHYAVYLDGKKLAYCQQADEDTGTAVVFMTQPDPLYPGRSRGIIGMDGKLKTKTLYGKVEIRRHLNPSGVVYDPGNDERG